jgi:hypothetical protein
VLLATFANALARNVVSFFLNHGRLAVKVLFNYREDSLEDGCLTASRDQELTKLCRFESAIVDGRRNCFTSSCKSGTRVQEQCSPARILGISPVTSALAQNDGFHVSYGVFRRRERQLYGSETHFPLFIFSESTSRINGTTPAT